MFRRLVIHALLALLVAIPLAGSFANGALAATSRVAIVKEWKGTVTVKKAGGSKTFKAFTKMSLNQGDILQTGADSSAVLQFANGSSEDDRMTVAANTTLTFSKLNQAKGTSTKVSMWSGSAWADVKSIETIDDEFTLQTPTAVMGVRGTHLLVAVDPDTGATHLTVAAGVVSASSADGGDGSARQERQVHPTQNALFTEDDEVTIAPVDLERLMERTDAEIVAAILGSAAEIVLENEQYIERYGSEGLPAELGVSDEDLERFKSNTDNLLGAIASQAVQSGLLTQDRLDRIIAEVSEQSGITIDPDKRTLTLTDEEKQRQLDQQRKEADDKSQAEARKRQEEADRKAKEALILQLEKARIAKEEANRQEKDKKQENATKEYEAKLTDAEKARFDADKLSRETETKDGGASLPASASPSPSSSESPLPTPSQTPPAKSDNAELADLGIGYVLADDSIAYLDLQPGFDPALTEYTADPAPNTVTELIVQPVAAHQGATVAVNGSPLAGWAAVQLGAAGSATQVAIVVTAEDGATTKTYTVNAVRAPYLVNAGDVAVEGLAAFDPAQFAYTLSPVDKASISMTFGSANGGLTINAMAGVQGGQMSPIAPPPEPGVPFEVPLTNGTNEIQITASKQGYSPQTYTFTVERIPSDNKKITAFEVDLGQGQTVTGTVYEDSKTILLIVPFGTNLALIAPTIEHNGASVSPASGTMQSFGSPVTYTVTAENGTTQEYTVVAAVEGYNIALNSTLGQQVQLPYPNVSASYYYAAAEDFPYNVVNGTIDFGNNPHDRWTNYGGGSGQDWLVVDFGSRKAWNRVDLYLFSEGLQGGVQPPASYRIEYSDDGENWYDVSGLTLSPETPQAAAQASATLANTLNTAVFDTVIASMLRITFTNGNAYVGVVELEVYYVGPVGSS